MTTAPLVSIITVCRNAETVISECLDSVADQDFGDVEHVVVDGASSDRTVDLVESARRAPGSRISQFVSEPDKGIYDAMNKGARRATGQFLYFLNADDRLFDSRTLSRLAPLLGTTHAGIVHGRILILDHERGTGGVVELQGGLHRTSPLYQGIYQQSVWTRRELYESVGYFDPSLRLCADVEWLMRALQAGASTAGTDILTTVFRQGGASADVATVRRELRISERRHYSTAEWLWCKGRRRLSWPLLALGDWLRR